MSRPGEELPDVAAMTIEDLRAEVEGGRVAYGDLVEDLRACRKRIRQLTAQVRAGTSPVTIALWKQDAEQATAARIAAWLRGRRALDQHESTVVAIASEIERGDWREGGEG